MQIHRMLSVILMVYLTEGFGQRNFSELNVEVSKQFDLRFVNPANCRTHHSTGTVINKAAFSVPKSAHYFPTALSYGQN